MLHNDVEALHNVAAYQPCDTYNSVDKKTHHIPLVIHPFQLPRACPQTAPCTQSKTQRECDGIVGVQPTTGYEATALVGNRIEGHALTVNQWLILEAKGKLELDATGCDTPPSLEK